MTSEEETVRTGGWSPLEKPTRHRVFILVDEIFIEIFLDQFFGLLRKVCMNERSKAREVCFIRKERR